MAIFPSKFQRIFDKATTSNTALIAFIDAQSDFWLKNLKNMQETYNKLATKNNRLVAMNTNLTTSINSLTDKVNALESVVNELASACESVAASKDALNQAVGAHAVYKDRIANLIEQLQLAQSNSITHTSHTRLSPKHPNLEKFNSD